MPGISVSSLELYRTWRADDELGLEWLLRRLRGEEPQTQAMAAGEALHKALEDCSLGEVTELRSGDYRFYVQCDSSIELPQARELKIEKDYDGLVVRGRVDGLTGSQIIDYKTTANFDADRLLEGYQWRYYLDMLDADRFLWKVFVLREFGDFAEGGELMHTYAIDQVHELKQYRYEGLEQDCQDLAADFWGFARELDAAGLDWRRAVLTDGSHARAQ